jgi:hypothetical protein
MECVHLPCVPHHSVFHITARGPPAVLSVKCSDDARQSVERIAPDGEAAMKTIVSALIALSVLAGVASQAAALDTKTFFEQQDRAHY